MWIGKRSAQDHLNDYWNALVRQASSEELARLRAQLDPELTATIASAIALHRWRRPDPAFSDRLEGDLMNAFALSSHGIAAVPPMTAPPSNGRREPHSSARWMPTLGDTRATRRSLAIQLGMVALLLLTLVGGFVIFSGRSDHPAMLQPGTPVSTPTQDWTNTRGDAGRTGLGASGPVGQPVTIWKFQADGPCDTAPAAVGDTVFSACGNGTVYALDRATGEERWTFSALSPVAGGPTVVDGIVVLVDADGRLYGVDAASGEERWLTEGTFYGAPVAKDGVIAVGGFDGQLAAIDLATGHERWRYEVEAGGEAKNPAIGDGIVYSGSIANGFSAVDLQTGEFVWHAETDGIETGTAVVANGVAYIGSAPGVPEGFLNAYDAQTGDLLWSSDEPIFSPAVKDGVGFAGSADGPVTAIDLATGDVLWQVIVGGVARPAVVAGDVVYMNSDGDEAIYAFDTETGHQLWKFPVDGYLGDAPALKDGVLYANTGGGTVYAIGGEHAIPAAGSSAGSPEPATAAAAATVAASPVAAAALSADLLWSTSGGDGGFDLPGRVAVAPDGTIWVVDSRNHRFQIFDANGVFIETWGEQGKGDGQFQMMSQNQGTFADIVFAEDGSFAVLDPGNGRVQVFDSERQFEFSFGSFGSGDGQFVFPLDLARAPDGTTWVLDGQRQVAQQFDANGTFLSSFRLPSGYIFNLGHLVDEQGHHFVAVAHGDNAQVIGFEMWELDADGEFLRAIGAPSQEMPVFVNELTEFAFGPDGNLYVGSGYPAGASVYVFEPDGSLLGEIPTDARVQGVAFDQDGNLIVSAMDAGTLSGYRVTGVESAQVAETGPSVLWTTEGGEDGFYKPGGITVAPDGSLWVADNGNSQFQILAPDGTILESWGEQGTGDGQLELRVGPENDGFGNVEFAPDGSFFVLDAGNFRVQHFAADRSFIAAWGAFGDEPGAFQAANDLAVDADGTVWVIDFVRRDAQHFDATGSLLGSFEIVDASGNARQCNGITIGPDGLLYITSFSDSLADGTILVYEPDGTLVKTIGEDVFARQAVRIAFDTDGRIYATEFDDQGPNGRVHIFEADGTLLHSVDIGGYPYGIAIDADASVIVSQYDSGTITAYSIPVE